MSKKRQQPKVCPFPGYEQKEASSIPLVVPDNFKYKADSRELIVSNKSRQRLKLVPNPEALELLRDIGKPVSVLTICGPARGGKSYILSRILGHPGAFKLGHSMSPQTYGVWMGTHYLDFGEYAMLLFDTEGTDAVGANSGDDISILLLATLLSSCLIYNSKNVPTKHDLQTMEWFTRLSSVIAVNSMKDRVQEVDVRYLFPDFLWLIRDVTLQMPQSEQGQLMTPREFMLNDVLEKNKEVGSALESCFATVDCRILPPPEKPGSLQECDESSPRGQNHQFLQEVKKLILYTYDKARVKNGFQKGGRVDGPIFSMLVSSYVEAINDPSAKPCIENSWKSAVQMRCSQVIADLVKEYEAEMEQKLKDKLPMEVSSDDENPEQPFMWQIHGEVYRSMLDKLREATKNCMPACLLAYEARRKELNNQFTGEIIQTTEQQEVVGGIAYKFFEKNNRMSHDHCAEVFDKVSQELYDEIKAAESDPASPKSLKDTMPNKIEWLQAEYFESAVGPAKNEVFDLKVKKLKEYGHRVAGFQKMMREVIDREALAKKELHEQLRKSKAATEEQLKTQEKEHRKMLKEQEDRTKRETDDLKRQIHDEMKKREELQRKGIELENTVKELKENLENVQAENINLQQNAKETVELRQQLEQQKAELKRLEAELEQSEDRKRQAAERKAEQEKSAELQLEAEKEKVKRAEAEAEKAELQLEAEREKTKQAESEKETAKLQTEAEKAKLKLESQRVNNRKIKLQDGDKTKITEKWFGCLPDKKKVKKEAKRLKLGAPGIFFVPRTKEAWIKYFGEQLYVQNLVMLDKTYDIEDNDIIPNEAHRKP